MTGFTTSVTLAECDRPPLVPVRVSVKVPIVVAALVVMLSVEEPEPLIEAGAKPADAPEGRPFALNDTVPVNPFSAATFTV